MFGVCIFIFIVVLIIWLSAYRKSNAYLRSRIDGMAYRAGENETRLDYYQEEIDRQKTLRATADIARMAVQHEVKQERDAYEARLKNARDAAEAIRARIGGTS